MGSMVSGNQAGAKHAFGRFMQTFPNARGKPHRSAKHGGYQQAELVGVGLTKQLGCGAKWKGR